MDKPLLYDGCCCAGGSTKGYQRAGFRVVGIDNKPQPHYCGDGFILMDILEFLDRYIAGEFERAAAIHVSPPCQYYTRLRHLPWLKNKTYWRSVPPVLEKLSKLDIPWIVENVEDCWDLPDSFVICGSSIGLELYRHRRFKTTFPVLLYPHQKHKRVLAPGRASLSKRHHGIEGFREISRNTQAGHFSGVARAREVLKIDWMTRDEMSQVVPWQYTEYIGKYLIQAIEE